MRSDVAIWRCIGTPTPSRTWKRPGAARCNAKEDPEPLFREAAAAFDRCLELNLKQVDTYQAIAELYRFWAEHDALRHKDRFREHLAKGLAAAEQALAINAQRAQALAVRGELYGLEARAGQSPAERQDSANKAQASLAEALKRNALLARRVGAWLDEAGRIATMGMARP
jgi:hypothetical protein